MTKMKDLINELSAKFPVLARESKGHIYGIADFIIQRESTLLKPLQEVIDRHKESAKNRNFHFCGCDYCIATNEVLTQHKEGL